MGGFHRFAYMRYVTCWLIEHKEELWGVLNKTAEKWDGSGAFHSYVLKNGLATDQVLSFSEFMKTEYKDPVQAAKWFDMVKDMRMWAEDNGIEIPEDYRGM